MKKLIGLAVVLGLVGSAVAADYTPSSEEDVAGAKTFASLTVTGISKLPVIATTVDATTARVLTSADYGQIIMVTSNAAVAVTLPANGAAIGSQVDVMTGAGSTDSCVPTISAATADTLVGPGDQDLDSVTGATGHRIGLHVRFISDGAFWHVLNIGGTTLTYTD
jgi:hypothetical protein